MAGQHLISLAPLSLQEIRHVLKSNASLALSEEVEQRILRSHAYLHQHLKTASGPVYGINTGFGALCNTTISPENLETLQRNLVMSHACGTGDEVPAEVVKLMLFLKVQSLGYGYSGVQLPTVHRLLSFFNRDVYPVVYQQGSLGASGDLAPLAHLCLPLIGLGEVRFQEFKLKGHEVLDIFSWEPIKLQAKEGLALLNGTQLMAAYGALVCLRARQIAAAADVVAALSLEAFDGLSAPFSPQLHQIRPHAGQVQTAARILQLLAHSELQQKPKSQVQDPYSFRCVPQVHGASLDALDYAEKVFTTEINAVTDNPNIFPDEELILSGGNFHGQPLALALDFLSIGLAEWGSISERRTFQLISGQRGLPQFLIQEPGLNSGFMIPQYTAASIVSQNKQLCTPASVDSIVSSNGQEDHVSMGANAAVKAYRVVQNVERILAIELMAAVQALEFRRPLRTSPALEKVIAAYRAQVAPLEQDRVLQPDIEKSTRFVQEFPFEELMT
ncbi:histidine ammonia-lyase [Rufibacter glacialis]|uniref:Histidine ammonia-lyase n=1 Tax=Rufibacter glacialis TaxID=1259555 RepID=A0A5M8QHA1_9BACT|nr:histidine ammonia-lyase [Rufibacter glacialis]KAA6434598.1 histidine ammonia-lyase [Rufibacter glacialis]GGK70851.1 histidine ammonia-lyase [Rufibacter glacialis]